MPPKSRRKVDCLAFWYDIGTRAFTRLTRHLSIAARQKLGLDELLRECYNQAASAARELRTPARSLFLKPMKANRSQNNGGATNPVQRQSELVFDRMSRYVGRLVKIAKAEDVHRFRTNSRRVEAVVDELAPESANKKKLLKLLSRLRKKAGKVRDLDVEIAFLKELKIPDRQNHKAQLLEMLAEDQARRSRKLTRSLQADRV